MTKRDIKTQAQTYTVGLINGGFEICDEPTNLKSYEKIEVQEGETWYGIVEMLVDIDVKDILNMDEVIETLKKMPNREFMQIVKEGFDDGYIELLFSNCPFTKICDFCDKDYLAKGKKGLEYTISHLNNTLVNFEVEVKFMFWIDEGKIKCKPVWEFEK